MTHVSYFIAIVKLTFYQPELENHQIKTYEEKIGGRKTGKFKNYLSI